MSFKKIYKYLKNHFPLFILLQRWKDKGTYPYTVLHDADNKSGPTIHFIHRYITSNTGDIACGYYRYFSSEFSGYRCLIHDINSVKASLIKKTDVVIIGGGGLLNASDKWNYQISQAIKKAGRNIIWSAGFNGNPGRKLKYPINWQAFALVAVRDFQYGNFRYVPCATCMMPELEKIYPVIRKIGVIAHKDVLHHLPKEANEYDVLTNKDSLQSMIEFIGSSEVVLTNSYHAVYWSTLMGKKCILFAPRSEKYNYYKYPPVIYSGNLVSDISKAPIYPDALAESKALTLEYLKDITKLIASD